jgi:putative peptide zinc metalloprotease protein
MGVVLLVLIPVPYVEASAANVFKSARSRAAVSAAGMAVELFLAALAFFAWLLVEPGTGRALLFNVMLVAGVSTLVFNGNPLLRYDAYYILADLIEMPNLAQRSLRYWGYLAERHAFGSRDAQAPEATRGEKAWMLFYGLASSVYRVLVTVSIALFIATQFFFVGVLLALWAVASMALWPLLKGLRHVATAPTLQRHRGRAYGVTLLVVALLGGALFALPAPRTTMAEGVIWLPEQAQVRAGHEGFIDALVATPGAPVKSGQLLARLRDAKLATQVAQAEARVAELEASYGAQFVADRAGAALMREQLQAETATLDELRQRLLTLEIRAATDGILVLPRAADLPGRYLRRGELLGHLIPPDTQRGETLVRVVVPQDSVDLVRGDTRAVAVRVAHRPQTVLAARTVREVPRADEYLPSRALSTEGGGQLATDPRDSRGARTLERTFQFDLALPADAVPGEPPAYYGERVHVRFEHRGEPLGQQALHAARRLFLSHFQW